MILICKTLSTLHPSLLKAKFGWNWPNGSGEEDFQIVLMYFCYFIIISSWNGAGSFIWKNWTPVTQECFVSFFVEISLVVLEEKIINFRQYIFARYFIIISPRKRTWPFIWTNLNPLYPSMLCAKFNWNWPNGSG